MSEWKCKSCNKAYAVAKVHCPDCGAPNRDMVPLKSVRPEGLDEMTEAAGAMGEVAQYAVTVEQERDDLKRSLAEYDTALTLAKDGFECLIVTVCDLFVRRPVF